MLLEKSSRWGETQNCGLQLKMRQNNQTPLTRVWFEVARPSTFTWHLAMSPQIGDIYLSCLRASYGRLSWYRLLWIDWRCSRVRKFLLSVYIWFMMLSCIYLGHSGNFVLILNLQFETKSGRKYRENIYKGNIIIDYLKWILNRIT